MQEIQQKVDCALNKLIDLHVEDEGLADYETIHRDLDAINGKLGEFESRLRTVSNHPSIVELFDLSNRLDAALLAIENYGTASSQSPSAVN